MKDGIILYAIIFVALLCAVLFLAKDKKNKRFLLISLLTVLLFETFVCNFHSFHLLFGEYERKQIDLSADTVEGIAKDENGMPALSGVSSLTFTVSDIAEPVGTLTLNCILPIRETDEQGNIRSKQTDYINVNIDAKDSTHQASFRYGVANGQIIQGDRRTKTIVLDLSGDVSELRIRLEAQSGTTFTLESVVINSPVPLRFSALRLILLFGIIFVLKALMTFPVFSRTYEEKKIFATGAVGVITASLLLTSIVITCLCSYNSTGSIFDKFDNESGNQISQEIVDAFEKGQVSLLQKPSDELLALKNPYDRSERDAAGVSYLWDHLLFEGKYYSYYGIGPVLTLFLPYHMLTGYYFPSATAILLFGMVGILFLSLIFLEVIKKFFPKAPLGAIVSILVVLQASSGIWYCFMSPLFYEIAQASGFAFTCAGFFFLLHSNVIGGERIKRWSLCLSSFALSMAVLCRPTLALYCVTALIFIAFGFFKDRRQAIAEERNATLSAGGYLTSALVCYAVIGGVQMAYNYLRFGSFLDFGIQYSLTINDFTQAQYHTDFVAISFWNYLFSFPIVKPEFPYFFSNFSCLDVNGYYFVANRNAIGLLIRALPTVAFFAAGSALKKLKKGYKLPSIAVILSVCLLCPFIIIFSIWESGYGVRYCVDFAWQMILGAFCIFGVIGRFTKDDVLCEDALSEEAVLTKRRARSVYVFLVVSALLSLAINGAMLYDYLPRSGWLQSEYLSFERIFDFWI